MRPKWKSALRKGAEVSLSGNLGFVALDEVLRLLSRSHQQGSVDVRGDGTSGRIFIGKRGIDLATTLNDEELRTHLLHSGLVDEAHLHSVEAGETGLAADDESVPATVQLLREMTVESIHQLTDRGTHFEVYEHTTTPYASPRPFELEEILAAARRRADDWKTVRRTVPDLGMTVDFNRDLGDREEIKVAADAWKVLSEIRAGSSVAEIADRLGTTDFWAARVVADLAGKDLVRLTNGHVEAEEEEHSVSPPAWEDADEAAETTDGEPYPGPYDTPGSVTEDEDDEDAEDAYGDEDAGDAYSDEDAGDAYADDSAEEPEEVPAAGHHDESWWEDPKTSKDEDDDSGVEEDTEAFLEKVFSELEETEEEHEGHGLLRRRRLGALRDLTGDS